jgi:hypothetical protein
MKRRGDERGADPAEIMPGGTAADLAAEEPDTRAHHDPDWRTRLEDLQKAGQLGQRSCQISVPEADVAGGLLHGLDKTAADRLGLAAVALEIQNGETRRIRGVQRFEKAQGAVVAAVVDEEKVDVVTYDGYAAKGFYVEAPLFVVAGDDQGEARHARAL